MDERIGKYELIEILGKGGFGTVYHAYDTVLEIERAVKILHPNLTVDSDFVTRFLREGKLAAKLEHPHIVPLHDLGVVEGRYFLVMKYMPGRSLKDLLEKQGPLAYARTLEILAQIAAALDFAHDQQIVHRDVKPANILFDTDGTARLGDFGFARALAGNNSSSLSFSGGIVGTPSYIAPEIWRSKPVTPAVDVYSLGCVAYEMLTGEVLFAGDSPADIMTRHVLDGPQFKGPWPENVPARALEIMMRALEPDPDRRIAASGTFVRLLEEAGKRPAVTEEAAIELDASLDTISVDQDERQIEPEPVGLPAEAHVPAGESAGLTSTKKKGGFRRLRAPLKLSRWGVYSLAIAAIAVAAFFFPWHLFAPLEPDGPNIPHSETAKQPPLKNVSPGKIAFQSQLNLEDVEIFVVNSDRTNPIRMTNSRGFDIDPAWSPDGTKIAFASNRDGNYDIFLMDSIGRNQTRLTENEHSEAGPAWSPDGKRLAYYSLKDGDWNIFTMNADGKLESQLSSNPLKQIDPSWSPDASKIVYAAYSQGTNEIYVMNDDGSFAYRVSFNDWEDASPDWSPDGTRIVYASERNGDWNVFVRNVDDTGYVQLTNTPGFDGEPVWSPDGKMIAFTSERDGNKEIYLMNADGSNQVRLTFDPAADSNPSWGP